MRFTPRRAGRFALRLVTVFWLAGCLAICVSVILALAATAYAGADESARGLPDFHAAYPSLGVHQFVLGQNCLSLPATSLELDCNPAFLANEEKHQFRLNLAFNDQVKKVNDYRIKLENGDSVGIVNSVLDQHDPIVARATSALWYQDDWWAIGYVPFRGGFASLVRNPAYPEISAHIYKESELFGKAGFLASDDRDLQVGIQLRYVEREFFKRSFDLLDALSDPSALKIESQKMLFVEPGLNYTFDHEWSTAVSLALTQLRVLQSGFDSQPQPILDIGFSTAPPFASGKLVTTTHYTTRTDLPDIFSRFSWGAVYELSEIAAISASLGKTEAGIGVNGHFDSVVLGIGYKTEQISPDQWQSSRISTVLCEAGLVF